MADYIDASVVGGQMSICVALYFSICISWKFSIFVLLRLHIAHAHDVLLCHAYIKSSTLLN
jgi:hypothetical protein